MSKVERTSFTRSLRGFLGSTWLSRTTSVARLERTSKSFSADPVDALDGVYSTISENYYSPDHLAGFQSVTRQLLANDVLGTLIQSQSDMLPFDPFMPSEPNAFSAHGADVYRSIQENLDSSTAQHAR